MSLRKPRFSFGFAAILTTLTVSGIFALAVSSRNFSLENIITKVVSAEDGNKEKDEIFSESRQPKTVNSGNEKQSSKLGGLDGKLIFGRAAHTPELDGRIGSIEPAVGAATNLLTGEHEFEPAWSPDGKKIVFISMRDGTDPDWYPEERTNREIYIMNADGTDQRRLTFNQSPEAQPLFSPDGTKILYVGMVNGDVYGDSGVFSMNLDGSNQTLLFDENCMPAGHIKSEKKKPGEGKDNFYPGVLGIDTPNFSPDMTNVIFSTGFGASRGIYRYNVAAGTCSLVVNKSVNSIEPRYSPDGSKIAINGDNFSLEILDSNGNLLGGYNPPDFGDYSTPVWSPDGTKIAYLAGDGNWGPTNIRVFDLNFQTSEIIYPAEEPYFYNGLSWGVPTAVVPPITLAISPQYSVSGGQTAQGIIQMDPATFPAGGGTVNLSISGEAGLLNLPQTTVTIPPGETSATFDINTIAYNSSLNNYKSADVIAEFSGDQARATVSVRPQRPDLRITTASAPATVYLGAAFNLSWTIENSGGVDTPLSFTDRIYFSTDDQLNTPGDILNSSQSNAVLGAGGQRVNSRSITLPHSLNPQNQQNYLIIVTNSSRTVDEDGNYENNVYVVPIQILLPDVTVENLVVPAEIEPNVPFNVSYTVRNSNAPTGISFQNRIFYSEDQIIGNGDDVVIDLFNQPAMTAGQTATRTDTGNLVSTIPVRPDGQWLIYVRVDNANALSEGATGETNNTLSQAVPFFYRVPDLQVTATNAPAEVNSQTAFTMEWTDTNAGRRAAGTFTDRIFFSLDNQVGGDTQIGSIALSGGLAAETSVNRSLSVTIPTTAIGQTGDYFVYIQTDATSVINEGVNENNNIRFQPIRVVRLSPDVVAENLTAPAEIDPGVNYNFSYTVRNAGAATTAVSFNNRLYFSFDQTIGNADDHLIDSYTQTAMTAGQTLTRNVNNAQIPTLPVNPDGQGIVYVKVDFANAVNEGTGGEANNTTQRNAQFYYRVPDLQVSSTTAPPEVDSDTEFAIEWTDSNAGNRNAGAFTDKVYFSLDNQVGADIEIGSFVLSAGLNAGASASRIQNVMISTGALTQTGNYFVYVRTDANSAIDEGVNENNNIRFHPIRVRRLLRPDLTVTNITAPNAAFFDQTIQVQWTVTNSGQGPTNAPQWKDKVFLHTAQTNNGTYLVAQTSSVSALNAGESYTAQATFKLPRGYNGTYVFTVKSDSDGVLNEENTANNTLTRQIQINVPPLPDLIVENVQVPLVEAFAGQELLVSYTIKNQGTAEAYGWRDRVYLSRDTTLNTSQDRLIFTGDGYESGSLGANQSKTLTTRTHNTGTFNPPMFTTMRLPSDVSGLWYVFIVTDYNNSIYEFTNENNNTNYDSEQPGSPLNIFITPPDLVVENQPTAPDSASSGQAFQIAFTVKNQGAFNAAPFLNHAVYLSADQTFDNNDTLLISFRDEDSFPPAGEHPFTTNVRLPDCLGNGNFYLFAVADYGNRQFEFDPNFDAEANNASPPKQIQITTTPPDLSVTNLQFSPVTAPGQSVSINWTVSNTGSGAANGNWTDRIILRSTNPQVTAQTLLDVQRTGGLAAGASYMQSRTLTLPAFMEGEYYFSVVTDYGRAVPECGTSENNNQTNSASFSVQNNLPDLVIDSITAPASAVVGDSFSVEWTGRNTNSAMPANSQSWSDYVYLSTDQTLSNNDRFLGTTANRLILGSNQTYQKQLQVSTGNIPAGNYYILVRADGGGHIYEGASNTAPESNNVRASSVIMLTSPSVDLQASDVTVAPPFYSGTNLTVSWTVTNFGATQTLGATWADYVILSRDGIIDPSDRVLGYQTRNETLAGGASYNASGRFLIPNGLTGDYRIFVITDYTNRIVENDNSNNTSLPFALELVLPPPADLNITNVAPPVTVNLGAAATFNWTVQNSGPNAVLGQWRDTIYLSTDSFWDSSDVLIGQSDLSSTTTPVASGATYTTGTSVKLTSVEEGTYYVIVRTDAQNRIRETNEANNVGNAMAITTVTITELPLNTPLNTTLENGGQNFYKFTPLPLETILLSLTTDMPHRSNELLTNFGSIVSRADYDFQGERPGEGNQLNIIPETQDGDYYSLVRTDLIPTSFAEDFSKKPQEDNGANPAFTQNITVNAQVLPFSIRRVSPEEAGNEGYSTLTIEGAKFVQGATVKLVAADNSETAPIKTSVATSKIAAIFDLKGKEIGDYDVVVQNPNNETVTLDDGFEIVRGGGHSLRPNILGPASLRTTFGGRVRYTFSAINDGLNDAMFVPIVIELPAGMQYELDLRNYIEYPPDAFPPEVNLTEIPFHFDLGDRRVIFLMAPILQSKKSVQINLDLIVPFGGGAIPMAVSVLPPLAEILLANSASPSGNGIRRLVSPGGTSAEALCWGEFFRSLAFTILGELLGKYEDIEACLKVAIGSATFVADLISGVLLGKLAGNDFGASGAFSKAFSKLLSLGSAVFDCAGAVVPPWLQMIPRVWSALELLLTLVDCLDKHKQRLIVGRRGSFDPNEKIAPDGYGAEKFVPSSQPMLYRINFENLSSATAPAQRIFISDELPLTLDLRTVRLKEVAFKQDRFVLPENQAFYQQRVQLGEDLNNLKADIVGGVDIINRRVFWTLTAIDPQTGAQPDDVSLGILPPNNENRDGEGYVTFTVEPTTTMPTRTEINNSATIIFDQNEEIVTNTTTNLLDSGIPASVIAPLPPTIDSTEFILTVSGSDDTDGSGLKGFDVYYSEDDQPYVPYITATTETSVLFRGKWGKSYRFYSIARDNAGNLELPPSLPDAAITVLGGDTEGDVAPRPNGNDGQISVGDVTQIRRFAAGLDTDFLYNEFQRADTAPLDTFGNGTLSTADVVQARRFAAGLDQPVQAAGPNEAASLNSANPGGNKGRESLLPREVRPVRVERIGDVLTLAVELEAQGDEVGVGFTLNFDPTVLSNPTNISLGSGAGGAALTFNDSQASQGRIGIILDKAPNNPFPAGTQQLVTIKFDVALNAPETTNIGFGNTPIVQEVVNAAANPLTTTFSAQPITLLTPTAASATVSGRVSSANGGAIERAVVKITGQDGSVKSVMTNSFGNFRLEEIEVGQTYVISVFSKEYIFSPQVIAVNDDVSGLNLIGSPR